MKTIVLTLLFALPAVSLAQEVEMPSVVVKPEIDEVLKPLGKVKETLLPSDYVYTRGDYTFTLIPTILVNAGFAKGARSKGDAKDSALVFGVGANFLYKKVHNRYFEKINFLSIGFNLNHEMDTKVFISPVNFTFKNNVNAGFALQGTKEDVKGGKVVIFVGFDF